jgi:hypothetical protein
MLTRKSTTTTEDTDSSYTNGRTSTPRREVTHEQIARRAFEISKSGTAGTPEENWYRAERELRARA